MGPVYHNPIFLQADYYQNPNTLAITSNINLGNVTGDNIFFQFLAQDFEGDTLNYQLLNGNVVPGNLSINANTGWLSGYINRDLCLPSPYTFQVTAYKTANNSYITTIPVSLAVENTSTQSIVWENGSNVGTVIPGVPSSLALSATVIQPFTTPINGGAMANCTLKVVDVKIINGGTNFFSGNSFIILGGVCNANAILTVTGTDNLTGNAISSISISPAIQQYTQLPPSLTVVLTNPNTNSSNTAYNAVVELVFGVDQVNILDGGNFYDTATIGFLSAGEETQATALAVIHDGAIQTVNLETAGYGYTAIPEVVINGKTLVTSTNPISYSLVNGTIPTGLSIVSNGLIVGIPSNQYFGLDQNTLFDNNKTTFDTVFSFTVNASVGTNNATNVVEADITHPAAGKSNVVSQDFQTLVVSQKTLSLTLSTNHDNNYPVTPKTNLSLEFLLDETNTTTLYTPLLDENIVPNDAIYRAGDFYFGVAPHVRMLMAYGITAQIADSIMAATAKYHHNKTFLFSRLKWAQSTTDGYEVIYLQPTDEFTTVNGTTFTGDIYLNKNAPSITSDSTFYDADTDIYRAADITPVEAYPATLYNMIGQLNEQLSAFDNGFLPTWMTDAQPDGQALGFVPAIPLLYVKPNQGQRILFYLQQYYDTHVGLNTINAVTDRYIWDFGVMQNWTGRPTISVTGNNTLGGLVAASTFTVNTAIPVTYTPNLVPRTVSYSGPIIVNLPGSMSVITDVVDNINALAISGFTANITANNNIILQNIYGAPFTLYDGINSPLQAIGILPTGTTQFTFSNITAPTWTEANVTSFDSVSTTFTDVSEFFELSDGFLQDNQGSVYIKFKQENFIHQGIVGT